MSLLMAAMAFTSSPAGATEGLAWSWDAGVERRYLIQADVTLSEMEVFRAKNNTDIRVQKFYLAFVTNCVSAKEVGKKAWELHCKVEDVQIIASPASADLDRGLVGLLDEWKGMLVGGAWGQLTFGRDGTIRGFDLEGIDTRMSRHRDIQEVMRVVLLRGFAGLELELPKGGDDGDEVWSQRMSTAMSMPSSVGTWGGLSMEHGVVATTGSVVEVQSVGKAVVGTGEMVGPPDNQRPRNMYDMVYTSHTKFDTALGTLVERDYVVEAKPTASSVIAAAGAGTPYKQSVHLQYIAPGTKVAPLGANEEEALATDE